MRALLCAGGTGGHLLPAVVLGRVLREAGWTVRLACRRKDAELSAKVREFGGGLVFLPGRGLSRRLSWSWPLFVWDVVAAFVKSLGVLGAFRPDVVVTFGGYLGFAPAVAAVFLGCPVVMVEQNSVPGLANRLAARLARKVLLQFEGAREVLGRGEVVGHPVDPAIGTVPRRKGLETFGLRPERRTLLVMGGSQGAETLNSVVLEALPSLAGWNIIWSCGRNDVRRVSAVFGPADEGRVWVSAFIEEMAAAYAAADVAVCRAGAATLSELAAVGLPALLVPYPWATDDHQYRNAVEFAASHPAVVVRQEELDGRRLVETVERLAAAGRRRSAEGPERVNGRILEAVASVVRRKESD